MPPQRYRYLQKVIYDLKTAAERLPLILKK